jgi:hypothetical protein
MLQAYVSNVTGVFRRMFQVFHLDVAYVATALPACFKCVFQIFHMFHSYVVSVSSGCPKLDLNVAYVAMLIHVCFKCFICFRRML